LTGPESNISVPLQRDFHQSVLRRTPVRRVIAHEWLLVLAGIASIALGMMLALFPGIGALQSPHEHPHGLSDKDFDALSPKTSHHFCFSRLTHGSPIA
jgi:hypothetical protein